ncbi:MAG: glycoside hydrolase family 43 protein [Vicinamibacterales bacterium]
MTMPTTKTGHGFEVRCAVRKARWPRSIGGVIALALVVSGHVGEPLDVSAQKPDVALKRQGLSGNPVIEGWYADPEAVVYGREYWIYPTYSDDYPEPVALDDSRLTPRQKRAINKQYLKQTFMDAFSSEDLVTWTKHPRVLDVRNVRWAEFALWAPSAIQANGKYYLFFAANDIQSDQEEGGIGVAVADRPEGPFADALGKPLVDSFHNLAQPIDPFVFRDDDGQHYLYYGGWKHCNVVKLRPDLLGVVPFEDGQVFKEVTPANYVEGPFVFKRAGKYYLMWSEGGWQGPSYSVAYAIGDSPTGPFERIGKVLQQDPAVATGAGHHSVIPVPGSDTWYIVYHRRPLGTRNGNHREVCIDEMRFGPDGTIQPVRITFTGVKARRVGGTTWKGGPEVVWQ